MEARLNGGFKSSVAENSSGEHMVSLTAAARAPRRCLTDTYNRLTALHAEWEPAVAT